MTLQIYSHTQIMIRNQVRRIEAIISEQKRLDLDNDLGQREATGSFLVCVNRQSLLEAKSTTVLLFVSLLLLLTLRTSTAFQALDDAKVTDLGRVLN